MSRLASNESKNTKISINQSASPIRSIFFFYMRQIILSLCDLNGSLCLFILHIELKEKNQVSKRVSPKLIWTWIEPWIYCWECFRAQKHWGKVKWLANYWNCRTNVVLWAVRLNSIQIANIMAVSNAAYRNPQFCDGNPMPVRLFVDLS